MPHDVAMKEGKRAVHRVLLEVFHPPEMVRDALKICRIVSHRYATIIIQPKNVKLVLLKMKMNCKNYRVQMRKKIEEELFTRLAAINQKELALPFFSDSN